MTITTRSGKGEALSHAELDENFNDLNQRMGWSDYNDLATSIAPITLTLANTDYVVTNDGAGPNSSNAFKIPSHGEIWNVATDRLDFSSLKIGDTFNMRVDLVLIASGANRTFTVSLELATGSGLEILFPISRDTFKVAGTYRILTLNSNYIGSDLVRLNPARLLVQSDGTGDTVSANGLFIKTEVR